MGKEECKEDYIKLKLNFLRELRPSKISHIRSQPYFCGGKAIKILEA